MSNKLTDALNHLANMEEALRTSGEFSPLYGWDTKEAINTLREAYNNTVMVAAAFMTNAFNSYGIFDAAERERTLHHALEMLRRFDKGILILGEPERHQWCVSDLTKAVSQYTNELERGEHDN
jgi:hypothetical protein